MQTRSKRQNFFLILMMGSLYALTPFSIDMYLPAFPEIASDLKATIARVSFSVASYFIGYALGQILYGPFLDRFGRRPPMFVGLTIYLLATLGCMNAHNVDTLLMLRFFQALGGSVASVATTAMARDFFPAKDGAKVFSLLMLVLSTSPLLAPTIGSLVVTHYHWRVVFGILASMCALMLLMIYFLLPEGHKPDESVSLKLKPIFKNFAAIFKNEQFYIYTFAGSFAFAGLFVYVAGSPAIFIDGFHVSAQTYGGIFAFLAIGMIGGGQLNLLFLKKFTNKQIFRTAVIVEVIFGAIFFVGVKNNIYGLYETIAFLFVLLSCAGITYPNAASIALAPFTKNVGSASSLLGFLQMGVGSLCSAGVGLLDVKGTLPTAAVMSISSAVGLLILLAEPKGSRSA